jgi:hypothetical protein
MKRNILALASVVLTLWGWATGPSVILAAGQHSASYAVAADVFTRGDSALAVGSARYQASVSVGALTVCGSSAFGATIQLAPGYQATTEGLDSDGDGLPDFLDPDSDGDGLVDAEDSRPYDTDNDGLNNVAMDLDDDYDDLADFEEWGFGTSPVNPNTDGDPHNDYEEWVAGTRGDDPKDFFRIKSVDLQEGGVAITWAGVSGRRYEVKAGTNLSAGGEWATVWATNLAASSDVTYVPGDSVRRAFFRLHVSRE